MIVKKMTPSTLAPFALICLSFTLPSLIGCTPDTQKIMTSVPYTTPATIAHISAPATINWQSGQVQTGEKQTSFLGSGGIAGLAINAVAKDLRPSWYEYSYGPAQQVIFVTSLRDALQNNQVFSQINFNETLANTPQSTSQFHRQNPDNVLIQLKFMDTAATVLNGKTQLFADVDLTLSGAHRPTTLTHLSAQTPQDKSWVFHQTFLAQEKELSTQLMTQAMTAIQSWINLPAKG
jgi:hypothetical protein